MIGEVVLVIEMGAMGIGKTIHTAPHAGASRIGMAAEVALGRCMDLPPVRK